MKLGLGTGSTAKHFVELLGEKVRCRHARSSACRRRKQPAPMRSRCGIPLTTLDEIDHLDLTVDGADEIDPALNLIKGGGGALLREKIVAAASDRMIVIADDTKWVDVLGRFPLPVEVIPFGLAATRRAIGEGICAKRRFRANGGPKGQGRPRFCHRWRPLDHRCPSRANSGCAAPGRPAERDPGRRRARACSLALPARPMLAARREFALLNGAISAGNPQGRIGMKSVFQANFARLFGLGLRSGIGAGSTGPAVAQQPKARRHRLRRSSRLRRRQLPQPRKSWR